VQILAGGLQPVAKARLVAMEDSVKNRLQSFSFVVVLALSLGTLGWGSLLQAQSQDRQAPQPSQPPTADQQQPDQTQSQQAPDNQPQAQAPAQQAAEGQDFLGTIVKSGDKWMFQDSASGKTYDIDHQEQVKKFEGKKVKVHGTLDESAKMIHVQ
jgi:hypothetical protein